MILIRLFKVIINFHKINTLSKYNLIHVDKQLSFFKHYREIVHRDGQRRMKWLHSMKISIVLAFWQITSKLQ